MLTEWFRLVVASGTLFQDLYHRQGGTRQQTFVFVDGIIQIPDVPVQIGPVRVTQPFHVAPVTDRIAQVIVLRCTAVTFFLTKNRIIYNDPVHARVIVGVHQCCLNIDRVGQFAQFVPQSIRSTRLTRPFGILFRGRIVVGQQSDQKGSLCEFNQSFGETEGERPSNWRGRPHADERYLRMPCCCNSRTRVRISSRNGSATIAASILTPLLGSATINGLLDAIALSLLVVRLLRPCFPCFLRCSPPLFWVDGDVVMGKAARIGTRI